MKLRALLIDDLTKEYKIFNQIEAAKMGLPEIELEQAYNGRFYAAGYAPKQPDPTKEEQESAREAAYMAEVDPITCHISRLIDEEQTPETVAEIEALKAERAAKVAEIRAKYPYPEEAANG